MTDHDLRVNVGCGASPTPGWVNIDNSITVRLSQRPAVTRAARLFGVLDEEQSRFSRVARQHAIRSGSALRIPLRSTSASVIYASHMLEHLDRREANRFLAEARRVLQPDGILRLVVPDLEYHLRVYSQGGDADAFMDATDLGRANAGTVRARLKLVLIGDRQHKWMYDGASLARLVRDAGFRDPIVLPPGETTIPDPGVLDLAERRGESLYLEARA